MKASPRAVRFLNRQLRAATEGRVGIVSRLMQEVIPFNRPHRIAIASLTEDTCTARLPFRRRNLNHLGTMHACALATVAEYASGLCVLSVLGVGNHRLIMSNLSVAYVRRAQSACLATATLDEGTRAWLVRELNEFGKAQFDLVSHVTDADGEEVAVATMTWHVKTL